MEGRGWHPVQRGKLRHKCSLGVQGGAGTSGGPDPRLVVNPVTGARRGGGWGRRREQPELRAGASASLSPSSSPCPWAGIPIPSRPAPSLPARPQTPPSRLLPTLHPPTPLGNLPSQLDRPHTLAMKGPLLGTMFSRHVKRHPGVSHPTPSPSMDPHPVSPHPSASLCPSPPHRDPPRSPCPPGSSLPFSHHVPWGPCASPYTSPSFPPPIPPALCRPLHPSPAPSSSHSPSPVSASPSSSSALPVPSQAVPARHLPLHTLLLALEASSR